MKKVFNLYNISLLLILVLISVLTLKTTEVKAAGTLTWPNGSTVTISRTVENVYNAPEVEFNYSVTKIPTGTSATFLIGKNVNQRMKNVANNSSSKTYSSADSVIQSIKRANSLPNNFTPTTNNTVSLSTSDYPIYIYFDSTDGTMYYYSEADNVYLNANPSYMFYNFNALSDISGLSSVNTSEATTTIYMFYCCNLTNTNALSNWDTSSVTIMNSMFYRCTSLTNINGLSDWDTSSVTALGGMFHTCTGLTNINALSNWDTSHVTSMGDMFNYCTALTNIDGVSNWDVSNVTYMSYMFYTCRNLTNIDALSDWDTSSLSNATYMFQHCIGLTDIDGASNWNTSSLTYVSYMFANCSKASGTIQILNNPTSYTSMFTSAATESGAQITVNYSSNVTNIDDLIATKSSNSNVVKGSVVPIPQESGSSSEPGTTPTAVNEATITFYGNETVSNNYTVTKSTTINLANMGLNFTEPGNYEYTVSESATSNNAYPTTNTEYTIVINVRNELNANNRPTGNLEARFYIKDSNDNKVNTMSFSAPKDESKFGHIELTKKVGGLMGGINTYFDFSIQIDDAASNACSSYSGNEKYPVSGGDASHVTISEVTKCKSGTKDSLSLKHNQTAIIGQFTHNNNTYDSISIDDYYKIVEASASNYTTTFKIGSGSSTSGRDTSSQSVSSGANTVTYVNTREGSPLTGIVLTVLPFLILIGIGAGGLILFRKKKGFKKIKKEELEVI